MNELEKAAELIERGWCKQELLNGDGKYCSVGAVLTASGYRLISETALVEVGNGEGLADAYNTADSLRGIKALAEEILEHDDNNEYHYSSPSTTVYEWNDNQKNVNDVLEMFKFAAKRL